MFNFHQYVFDDRDIIEKIEERLEVGGPVYGEFWIYEGYGDDDDGCKHSEGEPHGSKKPSKEDIESWRIQIDSKEPPSHSILIVGKGTYYPVNGEPRKYFVYRNSWGPEFGIHGFMRIFADSLGGVWLPDLPQSLPPVPLPLIPISSNLNSSQESGEQSGPETSTSHRYESGESSQQSGESGQRQRQVPRRRVGRQGQIHHHQSQGDFSEVSQNHGPMMPPQLRANCFSQAIDASIVKFENHTQVSMLKNNDAAKLDSFGRWLDKEIGGDCEDSLMALDSGNYWSPFETENDDKEVSSLSHHMQLDTDSVGPSLSQEQLYNISDFAAKLDSFGRWMDKEIGGDCEDSLMALDSGNYWSPYETENDDKEVSSLSHHMQLDTDSVGPSLSQEQLYSISDFAPDWAYSGEETKDLIMGTFLGGKNNYIGVEWSSMLGDIEVSAEVMMDNVIRYQVPFHAPGRVPFYITCSNRLASSEVREFEYRENKSRGVYPIKCAPEDEKFLIRLAKLLCSGIERKWLNCFIFDCEKCKLKNDICSLKVDSESSWGKNEAFNSRDLLIQNLLKYKLYDRLVCKKHKMGKGLHTLDDKGLRIIHLAAAVGYEWAIGPIAAAGVSLNFRDLRGRTALHWASIFCREETVVTLIRLGAASGAVDDPTLAVPGGQTAADLASSRGYKGIAGYLAEADLTSRLQALSVNKNVVANSAAAIAAENATEAAAQSVLAGYSQV